MFSVFGWKLDCRLSNAVNGCDTVLLFGIIILLFAGRENAFGLNVFGPNDLSVGMASLSNNGSTIFTAPYYAGAAGILSQRVRFHQTEFGKFPDSKYLIKRLFRKVEKL